MSIWKVDIPNLSECLYCRRTTYLSVHLSTDFQMFFSALNFLCVLHIYEKVEEEKVELQNKLTTTDRTTFTDFLLCRKIVRYCFVFQCVSLIKSSIYF